jgi:micrococcal nuclease
MAHMRLPRKYKLIGILFVIMLIYITGNTSLASYLPKNMRGYIAPSPTIIPTVPKPEITSSYQDYAFPTIASPSAMQTVKVTRVTDGDTIVLEGGIKLRYIGINAPESVDPRRPLQCFGKEASTRNRELVEGKLIQLEKDVNETDRYGRLLRYVYIDGMMINEQLVREGYAIASAYPPDVKHQEQLRAAERVARENKLGLWAACEQ